MMDTLEQRSAPTVESLATAAAGQDVEKVGPYREFLTVANEAHQVATVDQRRLMRSLAATLPTPEEATVGIRKIMGWDVE